MEASRKYATAFAILTILFFTPCDARVAKLMESLWSPAIAVYWIALSVIAIALGFRALRGDQQ